MLCQMEFTQLYFKKKHFGNVNVWQFFFNFCLDYFVVNIKIAIKINSEKFITFCMTSIDLEYFRKNKSLSVYPPYA